MDNDGIFREQILDTLPDYLRGSPYEDYISSSADDIDLRRDLELYFRNVVYNSVGMDKVYFLSHIDEELSNESWLKIMFDVFYPLLNKIIHT